MHFWIISEKRCSSNQEKRHENKWERMILLQDLGMRWGVTNWLGNIANENFSWGFRGKSQNKTGTERSSHQRHHFGVDYAIGPWQNANLINWSPYVHVLYSEWRSFLEWRQGLMNEEMCPFPVSRFDIPVAFSCVCSIHTSGAKKGSESQVTEKRQSRKEVKLFVFFTKPK